ncbi:MAG: tetratricopeptide repeat protein [Aquaticitalea sp.]
MKSILLSFFLIVIVSSCSKNVKFSPEFIKETSGRYLYNQDELFEVYYDHNDLFLKWKGASKIKPVVLDENTFFVPDMYKKLRFVQDPKTKKRYLASVSEADDNKVTYDYLKVDDTFKTPKMYLKDKEYDKAMVGYLDIQKQDSTSVLIDERELNNLGFKFLNNKDYENAISVFKINTALHSESETAYNSLGEAYERKKDSLEAFNTYKKLLELNSTNKHAKEFVDNYSKNH